MFEEWIKQPLWWGLAVCRCARCAHLLCMWRSCEAFDHKSRTKNKQVWPGFDMSGIYGRELVYSSELCEWLMVTAQERLTWGLKQHVWGWNLLVFFFLWPKTLKTHIMFVYLHIVFKYPGPALLIKYPGPALLVHQTKSLLFLLFLYFFIVKSVDWCQFCHHPLLASLPLVPLNRESSLCKQ